MARKRRDVSKVVASSGLRKVAEIAGVSTATVSRAINKPELVSPELRERITSIVQRLNWVPSGAARALVRRRTETVGAVFPQLAQGDFGSAIDGLQGELGRFGYTLLLACSEYDAEREFQQVRKMVERGVDAILLVGEMHHGGLLPFLEQNGVPLLNMFAYNAATHGTSIGPDNHKALYRLTRHLIELGHRDFGVIAQDSSRNDRARARLDGIRDALAEQGLAIRPDHFATGLYSIREGRDLFRKIMERAPYPTAVICGNAHLAAGAMMESQAMGIAVPGEISIAGYDDIELSRELPIPITTVRVPADELGRRAGRRIVALLEKRDDPVDFECDAEIILRASTGPVPPRPWSGAGPADARRLQQTR